MAPPPARGAPLLGARRLGWLLVLHPAFRSRLLDLARKVEERRERGAPGWEGSPQAKLLKRVINLVTAEIPKNPAAPEYEQGNTLGADAKGWRRAKFLGRFRLFFRFDSRSKVIVYAWVNDENTLRKAGSSTDPYVVFREKLIAGDPPHGWNALLDACKAAPDAAERRALEALLGPMAPGAEPGDGPPAKPEAAKKAKKTAKRRR